MKLLCFLFLYLILARSLLSYESQRIPLSLLCNILLSGKYYPSGAVHLAHQSRGAVIHLYFQKFWFSLDQFNYPFTLLE
uniref:Secreted protein n=1 Tax=Rhizophora mucronata TaxID=61149 RepID=A0A2P2NDG0_RHIMU